MNLTSANWGTSSYSSGNGGQCVEVATGPAAVAVRDSKDRGGPALVFTPAQWLAFTGRVKAS
jgi:Domain of unknown function (DUF397)